MFVGYFSKAIALSDHEHSNFTSVVSELSTEHCTISRITDERMVCEFHAHPSLHIASAFHTIYSESHNLRLILIGQVFCDDRDIPVLHPDLPFLLDQYLTHGIAFLDRLAGEFALLIFDYGQNRFYAARDHVGTVPLTLIRSETGIFFGCDTYVMARQLCRNQPLRPSFVLSRFYSYAENYSISPFENLIRVLPGHYIALDEYPLKNEKYWFPEKIKVEGKIGFEEAAKHLQALLQSAVSLRWNPAEHTAAHISGGLDSSMLAVMCRRLSVGQSTFYGFSWSPPYTQVPQKSKDDERKLIDALCTCEDIQVVYTPLSEKEYLADLNDWKHPLDFPYERTVLQNASAFGVNAMFSGWGADEFMGLRDTAFLSTLFKRGKWQKFWSYRQRKSLKGGIVHILNNAIAPRRRRPIFMYKTSEKLMPYLQDLDNRATTSTDMHRSPARFMLGILERHHLADRCESWYNLGQEHGIAYRYPMLDRRIIEYCLQLDASVFASGTLNKPLIRAIGREYLTQDMIHSEQLLDPVLFEHSDEVRKNALHELLKGLTRMKENVHLSVFNVDLLQQQMNTKLDENTAYALTYLAAADALTRGLTGSNQA